MDTIISYVSSKEHEYALCLRDEKLNENRECRVCLKPVMAPFYVCNESCECYIHKSCGDLPAKINHSCHPSHTLWIDCFSFSQCSSCLKDIKGYLLYKCRDCNLEMDMECAMMMMSSVGSEKGLQHLSHPHSLLSQHIAVSESKECVGCESMISGPAYGCAHCHYFLHKHCAESALNTLQNLLHPLYGHTLSFIVTAERFVCRICNVTKISRLKCNHCDFKLCWKCHLTVKNIIGCEKYHEHRLFFLERTLGGEDHIDRCDGYDAYCNRPDLIGNADILKEFKRGVLSSILKCLDCKFKVHLLCGPLPSKVKDECHIHPLTLHDSLIEDNFGEYYCDVCETERDPRIRIYYCEECQYFAHVHCLLPKILSALWGELEGVKLKALGKEICEEEELTTLTLKDLIHKLCGLEKDHINFYYKWENIARSSNDTGKSSLRLLSNEEIDDALQFSCFTRKEFTHFVRKLESHLWSIKPLELNPSDLELKLVKVKGYFIPRSLADVLKTVLQHYGDNIIHMDVSEEFNGFVLFIMCQVVKRMSETIGNDITKELLQEWFFHLRFLKDHSIKVASAYRQFERFVETFLGFQVQRLDNEIPNELKKKMAELERRLEKCEEHKRLSEKSEYMKHCLKRASELKWREGRALPEDFISNNDLWHWW